MLANDAGYIDSAGAPVQSVNAQSGAVVLDADDIDDAATTNKFVTAAQIALINGAVQNTGNESIAGDKTFTGSTILAATEVTTGAVLTVDGTQLATVPTIDFSSDATCGIGFADGGRNPGGLSFISNSAQRFTVADTGNISFTSLSLSSNQINSVADPTSAQDAATKNYVDTNAVLKTGDESIAGNKTFTGSTVLDDTEISTGGVLSLDGTQL
ncbi:MAG: hypothetical protein GWN55_07340, partial [Phycisphaerae bacterium]|nr:hypothetical protein [Phycisphaerae bacterium]NIS54158.1 hypothetical protein [Phycisphaerae bacterium]NIV01123.1 hypothetical protein [Phycisphaerae bacterium]NIW98153.1 hypothetical protein [Phycisphaerae bacterium]